MGPGIAGILSTAIGPGPTLGIDAVSFLLSALGLVLVRRPLIAPTDRPPSHILADIREGIEFIVRRPALRSAIAFWGVVSVTTAALVPALTVDVIRDLGLQAWALGLLLTVYGAGTVTGALLISRRRRGSAGPLLLGGNLARGLMLIAIRLSARLEPPLPLGFVPRIAASALLLTHVTLPAPPSPGEPP